MTPAVQVAVVSHGRADAVGQKTLRLLADRGVPPEVVRLYVTPNQLDAYLSAVDPGLVAEVLPGARGLAAQRRHVTLAYPEGTHLVQLDDDVTDLRRKVDDKEAEPVADAMAEFERGFAACTSHGARLWGVYPVLNPMFMKARIRSGLVFCIGHLWGVINTHDPERQVQLANKEDYERTLRYYQADGVVVRLDDVAARTRMFGAGGLQAEDQPDRSRLNRTEVMQLLAWWPQYVRVAKRRSKVGLEIRLVDAGCQPNL